MLLRSQSRQNKAQCLFVFPADPRLCTWSALFPPAGLGLGRWTCWAGSLGRFQSPGPLISLLFWNLPSNHFAHCDPFWQRRRNKGDETLVKAKCGHVSWVEDGNSWTKWAWGEPRFLLATWGWGLRSPWWLIQGALTPGALSLTRNQQGSLLQPVPEPGWRRHVPQRHPRPSTERKELCQQV